MPAQLAGLHQDNGRLEAAADLLQQSLDITRAIKDRRGQARLLIDLGQLRMRQGRLEEAEQLLTASMASCERIGDRSMHGQAMHWLGQLRSRQQRAEQAIQCLKDTVLVTAVVAGVLVANSAPHLATAVAGRQHLTPLAGRDSAPAVNLAWAAANLVGGALVLRSAAAAGQPGRWDDRLVAFEAGYLGWALWMTASEYLLKVNWDR